MDKSSLLDNFTQSGEGMEKYAENMTDLAQNTQCIRIRSDKMTFLSLCRIESMQKPGMARFWILTKESLEEFASFGAQIQLGEFPIEEIGRELYQELSETSGLMTIVDDKRYLVSQESFLTLCQQAQVSGDQTVNRSNIFRDMHLADALFNKKRTVSMVCRTADGANKVFAIFASAHTHTGQDAFIRALDSKIVKEYIKDAGYEIKNVKYSFTNLVSEAWIRLGDGDVCPGLYLSDSDTGHSSITARPVYFFGEEYVIQNEFPLRHSSKATETAIEGLICNAITDLRFSTFLWKVESLKGTSSIIEEAVKSLYGRTMLFSMCIALRSCLPDTDEMNAYELYQSIVKSLSVPGVCFADRGKQINLRSAAYELIDML